MNSPSNYDEQITCYLLGQCSEQEEATIRDILESDPNAAAAARKIQTTIRALEDGAPVSNLRLTEAQRATVLNPPASQPRFITSATTPFVPARRRTALRSTVSILLRSAAVVALCGAAFVMGKKASSTKTDLAEASTVSLPVPSAPNPETEISTQTTRKSSTPEIAQVTRPEPAAKVESESASNKATPDLTKPKAIAETKSEPLPASKSDTVPRRNPAPLPSSVTASPARFAFTNASRTPETRLTLQPAQIRPAVPKSNGENFAKPVESNQVIKSGPKAAKPKAPPIYLHSWKSEVAPCPWNPNHRLLRVVIQIPAKQPAADSPDYTYPVQIDFDPHHVRDYRLLCERHIPAVELDRAGVHVLWYEFNPNGAPAQFGSVHDKPVATISLPGAKFTTKTVGPFDETRLIVEDPGLPWAKARDDFAFESAVVGFGLLLRGAEQTGQLDYQLILKLARQSRGETPHQERDRFIGLIQDAQKAVGL